LALLLAPSFYGTLGLASILAFFTFDLTQSLPLGECLLGCGPVKLGLCELILSNLLLLISSFLSKSTVLCAYFLCPFSLFHHPTGCLLLGFMHEH
jgi:hypothetical protein